jgi:hypothetical protein
VGDNVAGVIRDVSVLTCNRPLLLERCLSSLRASLQGDAAAIRVRVLDDGTDPDPRHIRLTDRREMARRLGVAAGVDERLVTFALCGMKSAGPGIGAVRNTSLLLNAGRKHVQLDDDAICTPCVPRDADERRVQLAREDSHVTLQWYGDGAAPLVDLQPARDGFVEAHQRVLGRSLSDLARENDLVVADAPPEPARSRLFAALRVRMTQNSLVGDCGVSGPWWKTLRSNARADRYRPELHSREVLRTVHAIAISRLLAPTAFAMGIDGTRLVPPFLPCGKGEDALFVFLLNLIDEGACEAQLPALVQHRPDPRPPFTHAEILDSVTHLSIPSMFRLLFASPAPRGVTLEVIGSRLLDVFRSGWSSAAEELVPRVVARRRSMLEKIESVLGGETDIPDQRRDDLRQQASLLSTSIDNTSRSSLLGDFAGAQPELRSEETIVQFLRSVGELLQVWSALWSAAAEGHDS